MRYRHYAPAPDLRRYVHHYWLFEKTATEHEFSRDRFMPEPSPFMLFQLDGTYRLVEPGGRELAYPGVLAVGASRTPAIVALEGHSLSVGVRFRAGGSLALAAFAPGEACDVTRVDASWTTSVVDRLQEAVAVDDPAAVGCVLDGALRERLTPLPCMWADLEERLVRSGGRSSLDELVDVHGRSTRTFERACRRETGYAPSEYRALVRCDLARSALCVLDSPDLSALAYAVGFCDLPHFCRTFKRWAGITPLGFHRFCEPFRRLLAGSGAMSRHEERARVLME